MHTCRDLCQNGSCLAPHVTCEYHNCLLVKNALFVQHISQGILFQTATTNTNALTACSTCLSCSCTDELPPSFHSPSQDLDYQSGEDGRGGVSGLVIIVVTVVGMAVLMLNVLLIGCCLHRRANKRLTGMHIVLQGRRTSSKSFLTSCLTKGTSPVRLSLECLSRGYCSSC